MPVSHDRRCIFVHIPKTAGTSIEKSLGIFGDWRQQNLQIMFGRTSLRLHGRELSSAFLQHLTARELAAMIPKAFNEYLKFTVVRNPWDRMVSVFSNKDVHLCSYAEAQGLPLHDLSFDEFLERTAALDHAHLRPQVEYLLGDDEVQLVDTIAKWETLNHDFSKLCARLGVELSLPRVNVSKRSPYQDYYTPASRKLVADRYAADIETFAYTF